MIWMRHGGRAIWSSEQGALCRGNMNPDVHIYRYVTEKSFDSYLWQTIENKQRFISQIMSSKSPVRACDDVGRNRALLCRNQGVVRGRPAHQGKDGFGHRGRKAAPDESGLSEQPVQTGRPDSEAVSGRNPPGTGAGHGLSGGYGAVEAHPLPKDGFVGMAIKGKRIADKEAAGKMLLKPAVFRRMIWSWANTAA